MTLAFVFYLCFFALSALQSPNDKQKEKGKGILMGVL
jgi:hypothetical protein